MSEEGLEFNLTNLKDLEFICEIAEAYYERGWGLKKEQEWLARIRKCRGLLQAEIKRLEGEQ
jgi:DNA polymerase/3'-5' exonuclease PolX